MAVDAKKLDDDTRRLLDTVAEKLPADDLEDLRTFSKVGEWAELMETLCATLVTQHIEVSPGERDAIRAVLDQIPKVDGEYYPYLNNKNETISELNVTE